MTSTKLLIAAALVVAGTSASLAQDMSGRTYGYQSAYRDYNYVPGANGLGYNSPPNYAGTASGQPSPSSSIEAFRG